MPIILPSSLHELALFAGAGGGILGGKLLGWRTVCAVEWDAYARDVLVSRQNDGCLEAFPIWDDIQTFDGRPWRGRVGVVSGGFPCQDISAAGKGVGITGARSGMWKHMARVVGEILPQFVLVENSPMLVGRGLGLVLGDLAEMGYDAEWGIVGAHHAGAPHKRDRIWIRCQLAVTRCEGLPTGGTGSGNPPHGEILDLRPANGCEALGYTMRPNGQRGAGSVLGAQAPERSAGEQHGNQPDGSEHAGEGCGKGNVADSERPERRTLDEACHGLAREVGLSQREEGPSGAGICGEGIRGEWWESEPGMGRVAHGVAARVDRLRCLGNGQVPRVVPLAWDLLKPMKS